jgi:glycosyltransferase involved in cell wall biosynthesis
MDVATRPGGPARLRVTHVINTAEVGGGAEHLIQLTRALAPHGVDSAVIAGRDGPASARLREVGVPVEVLGSMRVGSPARLAERLRRASPDLLHLHGSRAALVGTLASGRSGSRPIVYTAHAFSFRRRMPAPLPWLAARVESWICRQVAAVVCLTRGDVEEAAARGVPTGRCVVIPNGIALDRFPAGGDRRRELGIGSATPVVGMLARLVPQKDPLTFVGAARRVAEAMPDARFVLAGDGPLRTEVERAARELIEAGRLTLTGFRSDVPELLATFDVVVMPSLWEGLPLALLESMAAGRAVVASRLPGHAEVIEEGVSGLLVPPGEPDPIASAILALLADPERRRALGRGARARVECDYSVERMAEATARLYRATVEAGAPGPRG